MQYTLVINSQDRYATVKPDVAVPIAKVLKHLPTYNWNHRMSVK
jgi:hypothetical protein